jgi:hypothetical protein
MVFMPAIRAAALAVAFGGPCVALAGDEPCVVELFTSQGCSSCPPADKLIAKLAHEPGVLALSFPVDYWDYIGWKDTFASPANTARQKAYAAARGDNHVYTPQVVVNGLMHAVGSDLVEIATARHLTDGEKGALRVPIAVRDEPQKIVVEVGGAVEGSPKWGGFWLLHTTSSRTVSIGRGENSGRLITYTNIVRGMKKIGDWTGAPTRYEIPKWELSADDSDGYALILQANSGPKLGPILAVARGGNL